jgi:hypothetical protein
MIFGGVKMSNLSEINDILYDKKELEDNNLDFVLSITKKNRKAKNNKNIFITISEALIIPESSF